MGFLLCQWMWIFSVRLCRCRVLEETVTAGMVSLMLGVGYCGFGYSGIFSLFFGISCSQRGLVCLLGFCYVFVCVGPAHFVFMEVVFIYIYIYIYIYIFLVSQISQRIYRQKLWRTVLFASIQNHTSAWIINKRL